MSIISGGRAIERGSHAELLKANGVYRKLWDDQSRKPHDDDDDDDEDDEQAMLLAAPRSK